MISNDSDLAEPIRQVRQRFKKPVVVLHPCRQSRRPSIELKRVASYSKTILLENLKEAQFPPMIEDEHGTITKPATW